MERLLQIYYFSKDAINNNDVLHYISESPQNLLVIPEWKSWSILDQIAFTGNVDLLKQIVRIPFAKILPIPLDPVIEKAEEGLQVHGRNNTVLYLRYLQDWCQHTELARGHLTSEESNNQLLAWLRRNARECYLTAPTRKWSIAMQIVFFGDLEKLVVLLRTCPPPRDLNIWTIRGRDGKTLLDVALEDDHDILFPDMFDFVQERSNGIYNDAPIGNNDRNSRFTRLGESKEASNDARSGIDEIRKVWLDIEPANILGPVGECPILFAGEEQLYRASRDCSKHCFSRDGLKLTLETALANGPFPVRCPGCVVDGPDRGIITRSSIKGLVHADILTETVGQRLLLQQVIAITDEPTLDYQFRMSKPCPNCSTPIAHYKKHGCHHIKPRGGCPICHIHFCYVCLGGGLDYWEGCPNGDSAFCDDDCDCPICPDCSPGFSCSACDGDCPACTN